MQGLGRRPDQLLQHCRSDCGRFIWTSTSNLGNPVCVVMLYLKDPPRLPVTVYLPTPLTSYRLPTSGVFNWGLMPFLYVLRSFRMCNVDLILVFIRKSQCRSTRDSMNSLLTYAASSYSRKSTLSRREAKKVAYQKKGSNSTLFFSVYCLSFVLLLFIHEKRLHWKIAFHAKFRIWQAFSACFST